MHRKLITRARIYMQQYVFFLLLLIIAYVHERLNENVDGDVFILYVMDNIHIIAFFDYKNSKNT